MLLRVKGKGLKYQRAPELSVKGVFLITGAITFYLLWVVCF